VLEIDIWPKKHEVGVDEAEVVMLVCEPESDADVVVVTWVVTGPTESVVSVVDEESSEDAEGLSVE
jgi:hypothetical protein